MPPAILRVARRVTLVALFSVPFLPLVVTPSLLYPYVTGKAFLFRALTEVMLGAWVVLLVGDRRFRPRGSLLLAALLVLVGVVGAADLLGVDPARSFWGGLERMSGYLALLHWLSFFLVAGAVLRTGRLRRRFLVTTVVASTLVCLVAGAELIGNVAGGRPGQRLEATFGNSTFLATYVLFQVFVLGYLVSRHRGRRTADANDAASAAGNARLHDPGAWGRVGPFFWGWPARVLILLHLTVLFFAGTRGALLGLVVGATLALILVAALERGQEPTPRRGAREAIGALLIVLMGFFVLENAGSLAPRAWRPDPVATDEVPTAGPAVRLVEQMIRPLGRLARIGSGGSVRVRLVLWEVAWEGFLERPLAGWGQENFELAAERHFAPALPGNEERVDRPHNVLLGWLLVGGIPAALAYVAVLAAAAWLVWRGPGSAGSTVTDRSVLTGLLAAYITANLFLFDTLTSYLVFFSFLAVLQGRVTQARAGPRGIQRSRTGEDASDPSRPGAELPGPETGPAGGWLPAGVAVVVVAVTGWTVWTLNGPHMMAAHRGRAGFAQALGDPASSLEAFRLALSRQTLATSAVRDHLVVAATDPRVAAVPETGDAFGRLARDELAAELAKRPETARLHALMGVLMQVRGDPDGALAHLLRAVELSPRNPVHHLRLADAYRRTGRLEQALDAARDAFELAPSRRRSRLAYAAAAVRSGREGLAEELLVAGFGTALVRDEDLWRAYLASGRTEALIDAWRAGLRERSDDVELRRGLAELLTLAGRRREAAEEYRILRLLTMLRARAR